MSNVQGDSADTNPAVLGNNTGNGPAVWGTANPNGRGVVGVSDTGIGVWGQVRTGRAMVGAVDQDGTGVWGEAKTGTGVVGFVHEGTGAGVSGRNDSGDGVMGTGRRGVVGISPTFQGVYGKSTDNAGVVGESDNFHAVFAISHSPGFAGVYAANTGGGPAAAIDGDCAVTGTCTVKGDVILTGSDVAEQFEVADTSVRDGTVVIVDDDGRLSTTATPYDPRVVGIVSGAGDRVPALVLDRVLAGGQPASSEPGGPRRLPLAVVGKAWCLAEAADEPIRVGDLLTTAARTGHAMRATDRDASFGAVIGKALTPLADGTGLVLTLVGLA
jgi:hypothetical protein